MECNLAAVQWAPEAILELGEMAKAATIWPREAPINTLHS